MDHRAVPVIRVDLCTSCGICVDDCPTDALGITAEGRPMVVRPESCAYCGTCEDVCSEGAIELAYEIVSAPVKGDL